MVKTPSCEKMGLKRGKWTVEEDELLVKYIQANGEGSWRSLPKNAGLLRCGKSCRLRWTNYLRPNLKRGKFTAEEDETIVKLHSSLGNRWSLIAQHLSGRTDNEIKNYWNSSLRRRIYIFRNLKEIIKITPNVPKIAVDGDYDESSKKRDTTTSSKRGSIGCVLPRKYIVDDIGSSQKNNLSCLGGKDGATLSEGDSIESLLPKHCTVGMGPIQKSNSSCPGGKDNTIRSRVGSVESLLPEDIENNSPCLGGKDDAMWSEEGSLFESLLLENLEINFSYPRSTNNATWSEEGSIESFLLENYIVDISFNRETNFSCLGSKDKATWSEEGSSIKSLLVENYVADLGLAMQQHQHHAKLETHEPRNEEEEEEDKNNKDIHVITREQQVCNGVWTFEE